MSLGTLHSLTGQIMRRVLADQSTLQQTPHPPVLEENDGPYSQPNHVNEQPIYTITHEILQSCGIQRFECFEQEALITDLDASLRYFQMAMNLSAPGPRLQPVGIYKYAAAHLARFVQRGDVADLDSAITCLEELLSAQSECHPLRPLALKTLTEAYHIRSESSGDMSDLDVSIMYRKKVLDLCPPGDPELEISYKRLAISLVRRSRVTNSIPDLDHAINLFEKVLESRPSGNVGRSASLANLAEALRFRYALTKDPSDYNRASSYDKEARDLCSSDQLDQSPGSQSLPTNSRIVILNMLSPNHHSIFIETDVDATIGQVKDIVLDKIGAPKGVYGFFCVDRLLQDDDTVGQCLTNVRNVIYIVYTATATATQVNTMPTAHPAIGVLHPVEGGTIMSSTGEGQVDEITDPLSTAYEEAHLATPGVASETVDLSGHAEAILLRFQEMGFSTEDIMLAIVAAGLNPDLGAEYLLNGIPQDLEVGMTTSAASDSDSEKAELGQSGVNTTRFSQQAPYDSPSCMLQSDDPLKAEVIRCQLELDRTPPSHPEYLSHLATFRTLLTRYQRNGDRGDFDLAIKCFQKALQLLPPGHPYRVISLNNLAAAIQIRYSQDGDRTDLDAAIEYYKEALQLWPPGHPDRTVSLNNLASVMEVRYSLEGDRADVDKAIRYLEEALRLCHPGHPDRATSLNSLAAIIRTRYDLDGDRADVDAAIRCLEEALQLCPVGHPDRATSLNNLAAAMQARYYLDGDRVDIDTAIRYCEEVLQLCPPGHPDRATNLNNFANIIQTHYSLSGDRADIDMAIRYHGEALQLLPSGHPNHARSLGNLAGAITMRYDLDGNQADINTAIRYLEEVLQLRPPGHPDRATNLNNLAATICTRYSLDGNQSDIDKAIGYLEEVRRLWPPGHPDRASSLNNLGNVFQTRHSLHGDLTDLEAAISVFEEACSYEHGKLTVRFLASLSWKRLALHYAHPSSLKAFTMSLELLDTQVAMSSSLNSQYGRIVADETLRDVWGLANDAAAVALGSERPQRAVELLEQGRGIVFAHLFRCRTALDDLQAASPRLAAEFATLSTRLEDSVKQDHTSTSGIDAGRGICGGDATGRHHNLTLQLNGVVREIRMLPGFATFLKPTPFDTLRRAADEGPVIIVNVSEIRSDAIILLNDREPEIVRLTEITPAEVGGMYLRLRNAVREPDARQRHRGVDEVLGLLWKSVVQHVVERLEKMGVPRGSRIWWCPTSWLCSLPLHAAGIYRPKQRKLPDMFISSHTTTLSALIRARKRDSNFKGQPSVLAVGVSQPEGRDGADGILPCVGEELRRLEKHFPSAVVIEDKDASHARVTEHLPAHSWVHLSCHGHQDVRQPFQSRFRLQDKPLSIQQIMCINLPNAELAYLSACHTATGDFRAPDEGLHLAAAMQFAGFRGVVGTLWAMDDIDGPDVAETFYAFMFRDGAEAVSHKDAAKGVWKISKALREKNVPLDRWANFIHVGA